MKKILIIGLLFTFSVGLMAQKTIKVEPENIAMEVGDKLKVSAYVMVDGKKTNEAVTLSFGRRDRRNVAVDSTMTITAYNAGEYNLFAIADGARESFSVMVKQPPITEIRIDDIPNRVFSKVPLKLAYKVIDKGGFERDDVQVSFSSNNEDIASTNPFGIINTHTNGRVTITLEAENIKNTVTLNVIDNPIESIELTADGNQARTGDVFHFNAKAFDGKGNEVTDAPILYSFYGVSSNSSQEASGLIQQDGRFVANQAGMYTVTASCGTASKSETLQITGRDVSRKIEVVGQGSVTDKHTSDLWIWEGIDGRDYAVTGTWGADGKAYFWDVTDPASIIKIDSVQVDARTVNDVKISEDGRICVISREGASNRKNGLVIIDVSDPSNAEVVSEFSENLTGGVHNVFIYENHVYALSAGQKYYIINIEDPKNPKAVGKYELDTPGHSIHDVWVEDGIAYSSNWGDGIHMVDVGNGVAGGSPSNPVKISSYAYPNKANHAAFPYKSKTGKFYVIGGDEIFPYGLDMAPGGVNMAGGYLHVVDFTDPDNPEEVARFEIPYAGSHNFWIEDDILYVAYYNAGVRIVDLSGELMGDLRAQGREMAWIIPNDSNGYSPNAPFTWGAQLHKGHIFYSDWNSGLWSAKMEPEKPKETQIQSK